MKREKLGKKQHPDSHFLFASGNGINWQTNSCSIHLQIYVYSNEWIIRLAASCRILNKGSFYWLFIHSMRAIGASNLEAILDSYTRNIFIHNSLKFLNNHISYGKGSLSWPYRGGIRGKSSFLNLVHFPLNSVLRPPIFFEFELKILFYL